MYILLLALLFTILVEFLVIWIFLRKKQKTVLILFCTILVNCFTLPLATYTYNYIIADLVLVEVLVILTESLLIKLLFKIKYPQALVISGAANVASVIVGLLIPV
ncbi:MAG: hypothetical protein HVN34_02485 [Methanobacteriaceae archaeon]|jgi:hypothetical protein|nr:hypothetical protein [Methanobacteriaceae archaeon]